MSRVRSPEQRRHLTFATTGWTLGSHKLFAVAVDSYGVFSDPLALNFEVL